jgi:DNA-directed RNA polymerase subunit alpha
MAAQEIYQIPIERLLLPPRTFNCLKRAHITKVGEVLEVPEAELLKIRNFNDKCLEGFRHKLAERGITFYPKNYPESGEEE